MVLLLAGRFWASGLDIHTFERQRKVSYVGAKCPGAQCKARTGVKPGLWMGWRGFGRVAKWLEDLAKPKERLQNSSQKWISWRCLWQYRERYAPRPPCLASRVQLCVMRGGESQQPKDLDSQCQQAAQKPIASTSSSTKKRGSPSLGRSAVTDASSAYNASLHDKWAKRRRAYRTTCALTDYILIHALHLRTIAATGTVFVNAAESTKQASQPGLRGI